ncbi:MAG: methyltransferase domain-containing protein [Bacteroidales bacterium]|nr:methyltransferase domain-containing protein [Bacteroidales bacterium]
MNRKEQYKKILKAQVLHKEHSIVQRCVNKKVLDVGCVGQDKFYESDEWLHKAIKKVAKSIDGVDINTECKNVLHNLGYNLLSPEELKELKERYQVIVMADVIEHVGNVFDFIKFYLNFLEEDGEIIITTPNPFSIRRATSVLLYKEPGVNPEHKLWLDPSNVLEILSVLNLKLKDFFWLHEYSKPGKLRYEILYPVFRSLYYLRKYYAPNFMFVVCRNPAK